MSSPGLASASAPPVSPALPAAVLWDMDGTLVDTEGYWMDAETALVESFGGTWSHEQALTLVGSGLDRSGEILQDAGVRMPVPEIIAHLTRVVADRLASPALEGIVRDVRFESADEAYQNLIALYGDEYKDYVTPAQLGDTYWVGLVDPGKSDVITEAFTGTQGVEAVKNQMQYLEPLFSALTIATYIAVDSSMPAERVMMLQNMAEQKKKLCLRYQFEHTPTQAVVLLNTQWSS